ncbi:hypothetical protein A0H81_09857 [Grifola frondosa]|uniref:Uncharacterized protein n=1 Tax=Grifola frondosa TaxID=5627 RepID=A0A1C7M1Q8_GRIFR|nr:hypothetical protein A0H81_09857 [Grifola frondosa]
MFDDLEADGSAPGVDDTTSAPADVSTEEEDDSDEQVSYSMPPGMSRVPSQPELEYAIISQLIAKIRELEETNAQITEEQKATEDRLRSVHWDAESIRRVYECLSDGTQVELQMVPEDLPGPSTTNQDPSGGTIRFSSLRRTIDGDISRLLLSDESEGFAGGITRDMQSTVRSVISQHKSGTYHKTRKTVVGLFDEDPESDPEPDAPVSGGWGEYPASLNVASSFRVRPTSPFVGDTSTWSHAATDGVTPVSPTLHNLQTPAEGLGMGRTLGSELGSEFGEDWGQNAGNHHLRTSSLYDLAGLNASREMSVSPLPSPVEMRSFVFPTAEDSFDADEEGPSTPPHLPALHLTVQPPTPSPEKISTRTQRLSQTVRARTNRWVEGRFSPASGTRSALRQRRSAATMGRRASAAADASGVLDETFDDVVLQLKRARSRGSLAALVYAGEDDEAERSAVELHAMSRAETSAVTSERKEGFVGLVLEVWLWLQFVIVVLVFLWAMAKRGPKSVLEEAERRKVAQGH